MKETTINIGGEKFAITKEQKKDIECFRIGDMVKILKKEYSEPKVYPATVVGFENFKELPTIVLAYIKTDYSSATLEFLYYNEKTKDTAIAVANDHYVAFEKNTVIERMNRDIEKKETELIDLKQKKEYFLTHFDKYFAPIVSYEDEDKVAA